MRVTDTIQNCVDAILAGVGAALKTLLAVPVFLATPLLHRGKLR